MKLKILTLALVAPALLAACGESERSVSTPVAAVVADQPPSHQQLYIDTLREKGIIPTYGSEATLVDLAHAVCDGYDAGLTDEDLFVVLLDNGFTASDGGYVVGASVAAFCPEHV